MVSPYIATADIYTLDNVDFLSVENKEVETSVVDVL